MIVTEIQSWKEARIEPTDVLHIYRNENEAVWTLDIGTLRIAGLTIEQVSRLGLNIQRAIFDGVEAMVTEIKATKAESTP